MDWSRTSQIGTGRIFRAFGARSGCERVSRAELTAAVQSPRRAVGGEDRHGQQTAAQYSSAPQTVPPSCARGCRRQEALLRFHPTPKTAVSNCESAIAIAISTRLISRRSVKRGVVVVVVVVEGVGEGCAVEMSIARARAGSSVVAVGVAVQLLCRAALEVVVVLGVEVVLDADRYGERLIHPIKIITIEFEHAPAHTTFAMARLQGTSAPTS